MYNFVKLLNDRQALLSKDGTFFVASQSLRGPQEVLVFPATADGKIIDWSEVDGGRGYTLASFMEENVTR